MAAAQQSAAQVSSLLGGTPASDRRIQDMLNDLLASKSRAELWEVMRMLKNFLGGDREAAKQFFAERPGLTKAVFQTQVLLGELRSTQRGHGSCVSKFGRRWQRACAHRKCSSQAVCGLSALADWLMWLANATAPPRGLLTRTQSYGTDNMARVQAEQWGTPLWCRRQCRASGAENRSRSVTTQAVFLRRSLQLMQI